MFTLSLGIIIGMLIGRLFRTPEHGCPQAIQGYKCKGRYCDHRLSEYYRIKSEIYRDIEIKSLNRYE